LTKKTSGPVAETRLAPFNGEAWFACKHRFKLDAKSGHCAARRDRGFSFLRPAPGRSQCFLREGRKCHTFSAQNFL
jgi:hypothetical protein